MIGQLNFPIIIHVWVNSLQSTHPQFLFWLQTNSKPSQCEDNWWWLMHIQPMCRVSKQSMLVHSWLASICIYLCVQLKQVLPATGTPTKLPIDSYMCVSPSPVQGLWMKQDMNRPVKGGRASNAVLDARAASDATVKRVHKAWAHCERVFGTLPSSVSNLRNLLTKIMCHFNVILNTVCSLTRLLV